RFTWTSWVRPTTRKDMRGLWRSVWTASRPTIQTASPGSCASNTLRGAPDLSRRLRFDSSTDRTAASAASLHRAEMRAPPCRQISPLRLQVRGFSRRERLERAGPTAVLLQLPLVEHPHDRGRDAGQAEGVAESEPVVCLRPAGPHRGGAGRF